MPADRRQEEIDAHWMRRALEAAEARRGRTAPNPAVGCVIVPAGVEPERRPAREPAAVFTGATGVGGRPHAETVALEPAGGLARGATAYVTLEPCAHHGATPPCAGALADAGVARVVVGAEDPDPRVAGAGIAALASAGVEVDRVRGPVAEAVARQLEAYVHQRTTGRPFVVLKLAATLDGRTAAPDGSSRWITGEAARRDAHELRAVSDAVVVGAGTVRADDPSLTVRLDPASPYARDGGSQPRRVVLGTVPPGAAVAPADSMSGTPAEVVAALGADGALQVLVEGGATVAHDFLAAGVVDLVVLYLAPSLFGGDDGVPLFRGPGAPTMAARWMGRVRSLTSLGDDIRLEWSGGTGSG